MSVTCRKCKEYGHNSRCCPNFPWTLEFVESTLVAGSAAPTPKFDIA